VSACWIYECSAKSRCEFRSALCTTNLHQLLLLFPIQLYSMYSVKSSLHSVHALSICLKGSPRSNVNLLIICVFATFIPTRPPQVLLQRLILLLDKTFIRYTIPQFEQFWSIHSAARTRAEVYTLHNFPISHSKTHPPFPEPLRVLLGRTRGTE